MEMFIPKDIARIILCIQEEIETVQLDGCLILRVLREIGKALLLLAQRVEYQTFTGSKARQVTDPTTSSTTHIPNPQYPSIKPIATLSP